MKERREDTEIKGWENKEIKETKGWEFREIKGDRESTLTDIYTTIYHTWLLLWEG